MAVTPPSSLEFAFSLEQCSSSPSVNSNMEQAANHLMGHWSRVLNPWLLESTAQPPLQSPQHLQGNGTSSGRGTRSRAVQHRCDSWDSPTAMEHVLHAPAPRISGTKQHGPHGRRVSGAESQVQEYIEQHHCTGSCGCPACGFISSRKAA